jgi:PPK2 family polyphosphate:nucleotide phosphotransferase
MVILSEVRRGGRSRRTCIAGVPTNITNFRTSHVQLSGRNSSPSYATASISVKMMAAGGLRRKTRIAASAATESDMNYLEMFKVAPGSKVKLREIDPGFKDAHESHDSAAEEIAQYQKKLSGLQDLFYAEHRHSLLICLQALDTGGKDGAIRHVLGAMNPQGCRVAAFKEPTPEELAHDFLWRAHKAAPARGEVVIFNRSHYEDVLIVRVHNLVPKEIWSRRYDEVNDFERNLAANDTHILKFFLHISKEEQLKRFKDRLDDPAKHWKISEADYKERGFWDDYTAAYEESLSRCSTSYAPWFIIPGDHKWFRNLAIARIVVEHLESLKMQYPKPTVDLERIRREYHAAAKEK